MLAVCCAVMSSMAANAAVVEPFHATPVSIGPILLVYVTDGDLRPTPSVTEARSLIWGQPGLADALRVQSWGQTVLAASALDVHELETNWRPSAASWSDIRQQLAMALAARVYSHVLVLDPTGAGTAYGEFFGARPRITKYPTYMQTWQTFLHEVSIQPCASRAQAVRKPCASRALDVLHTRGGSQLAATIHTPRAARAGGPQFWAAPRRRDGGPVRTWRCSHLL